MERKALGKGISALIPERSISEPQAGGIALLKLDKIKPSPFQPRENFNQNDLEELTNSIREKGIIQPILVRRKGDLFELIAGERRFRAANILNLKEIPAIIKNVDDKDSLEIALIENIQRQDLNPIEEARAFQFLMDKFSLTQEEVSEVLGKARTTITNMLRLLKLPQEIQEDIRNNRISFAHGRALLEIEDVNQQRKLAQDVIAKGLSVRELESLIKARRPRSQKISARHSSVRDPLASVLEERLQHALATKVRVVMKKKRGHVTIDFYSQEDLERITNKITGGNE